MVKRLIKKLHTHYFGECVTITEHNALKGLYNAQTANIKSLESSIKKMRDEINHLMKVNNELNEHLKKYIVDTEIKEKPIHKVTKKSKTRGKITNGEA